jgi:DNA-binding MarR family transcriptional regulator
MGGVSEAGPAREWGELLADVSRLVRRDLRPDPPGRPLSPAQAEVLLLVRTSPGIRVSAAAGELRLAANSVSTLVRQLTGLGLMTREPDPRDARAALLHVTPAGAERLHGWEERRAGLYRAQWARLAAADRSALEAALPALRRLAANLHEESRTRTGK